MKQIFLSIKKTLARQSVFINIGLLGNKFVSIFYYHEFLVFLERFCEFYCQTYMLEKTYFLLITFFMTNYQIPVYRTDAVIFLTVIQST